jgi:hypothetical protein
MIEHVMLRVVTVTLYAIVLVVLAYTPQQRSKKHTFAVLLGFSIVLPLIPSLEQLLWVNALITLVFLLSPLVIAYIRPSGSLPMSRYDVLLVVLLWIPIFVSDFAPHILLDFWMEVLHAPVVRFSLLRGALLFQCLLIFKVERKFDRIGNLWDVRLKDVPSGLFAALAVCLILLPVGFLVDKGFSFQKPTYHWYVYFARLLQFFFIALAETVFFQGILQDLVVRRFDEKVIERMFTSLDDDPDLERKLIVAGEDQDPSYIVRMSSARIKSTSIVNRNICIRFLRWMRLPTSRDYWALLTISLVYGIAVC